jgi:imidazoleglycerol phosphate synthase glutamine amidotransferase subunit HisH
MIVIVDYGLGNISNVKRAIEYLVEVSAMPNARENALNIASISWCVLPPRIKSICVVLWI